MSAARWRSSARVFRCRTEGRGRAGGRDQGTRGQGDKGTRGQGDKGTRGQGDKGMRDFGQARAQRSEERAQRSPDQCSKTRRHRAIDPALRLRLRNRRGAAGARLARSLSPCLLVSLSPSPPTIQRRMHRTTESTSPTQSAYPALSPPVKVSLVTLPAHPCPYLPGRMSRSRAFWGGRVDPGVYHKLMDANFRRSGRLVYQPVCRGCRACQSIRVPVAAFKPDKSQRRCRRKNEDLVVTVGEPQATDEKFELYRRYQIK